MMRAIDSHTAGQPTRIVVEGLPDLGTGTMADRADRLQKQFDRFRSAVVGEPRGSDALVGGMLTTPADPANTAGVIFFDNTGYPAMSGHALIGFVATLEYMGRIRGVGAHRIETPAGVIATEIHPSGEISITNVPSFRHQRGVDADGVTGDIAWGGEWFFLADTSEALTTANVPRLLTVARTIRESLARNGVVTPRNTQIDHVALFGPAQRRGINSRNFVLRGERAHGRSPCGTALSAKLACLYEDGALQAGQPWRQESITGTVFDALVQVIDGATRPIIRSNAYITAESMLIVDERDPFCWGM